MVIKFPCGVCEKAVAKSHKALRCDICNQLIHIKCNNVSNDLYNSLILEHENPFVTDSDRTKWICINCINSNLPFSYMNDASFYLNSKGIHSVGDFDNFNFSLNPSDKQISNQISKMIVECTDPDNNQNFCNYYETDDFLKAKFDNLSNLSVFHLNIASLQYHFEELKILLNMLDFVFDLS